MRSTDKGVTWQHDPPRACKEMAWGESSDGTVLAFDRDTFEICQGRYLGSFFVSKDGGKTFAGPRECQVHVNGVASRGYPPSEAHFPEDDHIMRRFFSPIPDFYKPLIEKSSHRRGLGFWRYMLVEDGRWLATMQGFFYGDNAQRSVLVESTDGGRTWQFVATIAYEFLKLIDGVCEPVMRKVADGSLLCMMRRHGVSKGNMAQCRSTDGGRSWTKPEIQIAHGVDPDLCLMSNGVLACTYGRPGRYVMFSEDGCGYSWGYRTEIGLSSSSAMMGMAEISPGTLLVVYDERIEGSAEAGRDPESCYIGATTVAVERVPIRSVRIREHKA